MASHPEEADNLPETRSEETKALERQREEDKFDAMSLLVSMSSLESSTSKSKRHEAADVTLSTARLTFLDDEMSLLEESVAEKDCTTIAVPVNFSDELSEVTREEVISSFRGKESSDHELENLILQHMPLSLDRINETLSTVAECQSKHYNQTIDGQIRSERNQERIINLLENQFATQEALALLSEALVDEKVEAEVARRLAKKEKTEANNRDSKANAARPSMRSSSKSTKCVAADNSTPFRDTTNIRSARSKKLTEPKGPGTYQKWKEKNAARARKEDSRRSQAPGRKLPWE